MNALPHKPAVCPLCQGEWIKIDRDGQFDNYRCANYSQCGLTYWFAHDSNYCLHKIVNKEFVLWWDCEIGMVIDFVKNSNYNDIDYNKRINFETILPFNITAEQIRLYLIMS